MISKQQAIELVKETVNARRLVLSPGDEIIILQQETIDKPWGWVFFYTSRKWFETNDDDYAIAGNAPIIVEKASGKCFETGTAYPVEHYLARYEHHGDPHA